MGDDKYRDRFYGSGSYNLKMVQAKARAEWLSSLRKGRPGRRPR